MKPKLKTIVAKRRQPRRAPPSPKGWYHSGKDSFEHPRIACLAADEYVPGIEYGPFPTFKDAQSHLVKLVAREIEALQTLRTAAYALREGK